VNDNQPEFVLATLKKVAGELKGKKIAALGLSFKPDVDDLRESPAIEVVHLMIKEGASVSTYEPFKPDFQVKGATTALTMEAAIKNADVILLLVGHKQFKSLDPSALARQTSARLALDTVNGWDSQFWSEAGFQVKKLGRGKQ
jgi:UDP-N-acetyl-D-mannosaminuronic acid dehydrogenase